MPINDKCKICRRQGAKLFLKGERCLSPKCAILRKPYPPGNKSKSRRGSSEYGKQLKEKQKLKNWYNLREGQFKKYVQEVLDKRGQVQDAGALLMKKLVSRLDSVVFRLGFANSRAKARQLVNHGHFLINGKKIDIPSYQVRIGDKITLREASKKKPGFENVITAMKKQTFPPWVEFDAQKLEAKVISEPLEESEIPAEISTIFEFYSR